MQDPYNIITCTGNIPENNLNTTQETKFVDYTEVGIRTPP